MRRATIAVRILLVVLLGLVLAGLGGYLASAFGAPKAERRAEKKAEKAADKADKPKPAPKPAPDFTPEAVDAAIARATKFLWSRQDKEGSWGPYAEGHKYEVGPTALVAYALMESGVNPQDPRMTRTLDWLGKQKTEKTYELACRANAYLAADRSTSDKYRKLLDQDAAVLIKGGSGGHYTYDCTGNPQLKWDNSNSQFGLLGVWAADHDYAGEIHMQYWRDVMHHWETCQNPDGGWGYRDAGGGKREATRATMTVGGIATLFVCFDRVWAAQFVNCQQKFNYQPILKALDWLDKNFPQTVRAGGKQNYYYLYGVERAALASGYKYFGKSDWYKLGAAALLKSQDGNGGWDNVVNTAFSLLFLVRGKNAVVFNKLQYEGDWNNRPRDLANLTSWMSRTFERTVNWQIINLRVPVDEWHDAPILYIAGSTPPKFTDDDLKKLRAYVLQGGTILSVTECGGEGFRKGIRETYEKMFPQYALQPLPAEHELYTRKVYYDLPARLPLSMITNGVRPLVIHCDADLPLSWQLRKLATARGHFEAAANIVRYVSDSIASLRARGSSHWPEAEAFTPARTIKVARVKHPGNWHPEPLADERFERLMGRETRTKIEFQTVSIAELPRSGCKVALMTGTGKCSFLAPDHQAIKQYAEGGGTLVIDAAGGSVEFAQSADKMIKAVFGEREPRLLAPNADLFTLKGYEIPQVRYHPQTRTRLGNTRFPNLRAAMVNNRPAVLFSPEDLTLGLLGISCFTVDGYTTESAFDIMRNIVLWAGK